MMELLYQEFYGCLRSLSARDPRFLLLAVAWMLVMIGTPIGIWVFGERVFSWFASLMVFLQVILVIVSLMETWPAKRTFGVFLLVALLTWVAEWSGTHTGFPFGGYHYTVNLQPQIVGVPIWVPLAWWMMLPPAWAVAQHLTPQLIKPTRSYLIFSFIAASAFTAWDLYLDPQMVAWELWVWESAGGYFGIPWSNYIGWWIISFLLTLIIRPNNLPLGKLLFIYAVAWLLQAIGLGIFWGQPGPAFVGFLGMGIFVLMVISREARHWKQRPGFPSDP